VISPEHATPGADVEEVWRKIFDIGEHKSVSMLYIDSAMFDDLAHESRPSPRPDRGRRPAPYLAPDPDARPAADPTWTRAALVALLALTAVTYTWNLGASGWANAFYSAAVQAATVSWKAFFYGSFDAANFITVDKPPLFLWVMDLAARLFGLSAWSILVPEALEGVATVALVWAAVRRWFGAPAGLLAGLVVALTPVAALMFRYNNPDAMLTLLATAAAYATVRALERGSTAWLLLAAALAGSAFLAKMLEAFAVVPALAVVVVLAAPGGLGRRLGQLLLAAVTLVVSAGWWVAIVQLTPPWQRPYIGSSQNNSLLSLIFGYNGLGRLTGQEAGSVGAGGPLGVRWGPTGIDRLFLPAMAGQISWLLPAAALAGLALLWIARGRPRTDRLRAATVLWGGWLAVVGLVFSLGQGIIHPYYTVLLAPPIGALTAIGALELWKRRGRRAPRLFMALVVTASAEWASMLLGMTPHWLPPLKDAVVGCGLAAAVALVAWPPRRPHALAAAAALALAALLAGPAAYTVDTAATPHSGAIPAAGPALASRPAAAQGGSGGALGARAAIHPRGLVGGVTAARRRTSRQAALAVARALLRAPTPGSGLRRLLDRDASRYTWVAAAVGANNAAGYQLATRRPVMAIGGFNSTDPAPTLAQFERDVRGGRIHYFIGGFPGAGSDDDARRIARWVARHYRATVVDGVPVYALAATAPSPRRGRS
jgi:4-amino-4-deoxy-L-arabinose transferase-like glycosyltransferase